MGSPTELTELEERVAELVAGFKRDGVWDKLDCVHCFVRGKAVRIKNVNGEPEVTWETFQFMSPTTSEPTGS